MNGPALLPAAIGDTLWFDLPDYQSNPIWRGLSEERRAQVQQMRDLGYVIVDKSVSEAAVDRALEAFARWKAQNAEAFNANRKPNGDPPRLVDFHSAADEISALFTHNTSLELQDILFGWETSIYTSLFFEVSTEQPIHRDVPVFRTAPENFYFGMWVALEDALPRNGTLRVIEGGHKVAVDQYAIGERFYSDPFDIPKLSDDMWNAYQAAVDENCAKAGLSVRQVEVKKGQTLVWHPLLPHGGGRIEDRKYTRNSIVFHTVPLGVPVYRQDVFFNREATNVTPRSAFQYRTLPNGRSYAEFGGVKMVGR